MPEGLITLSKHACFGGAVSFHEHRPETYDVTMRFAVYAPARRVLGIAVAQEEQGSGLCFLISYHSPPVLGRRMYCNLTATRPSRDGTQ